MDPNTFQPLLVAAQTKDDGTITTLKESFYLEPIMDNDDLRKDFNLKYTSNIAEVNAVNAILDKTGLSRLTLEEEMLVEATTPFQAAHFPKI